MESNAADKQEAAVFEASLDVANQYMELLNLEDVNLIENVEQSDCPICFVPVQPHEGVVLRDCLHSFCKECLISTVKYATEAEICCPYSDGLYSCKSVMQDREIKSLVCKELYEAHLYKSIQQAESAIDNTFHCRTPNCCGWCIYEDNVNQFKCPVCESVNCLTCRAVHEGMNCNQYQFLQESIDKPDELSRNELLALIKSGRALNCPKCHVIVMKVDGCDFLTCTMCKTAICWATRGPRWGPAGRGDTSGGCRCNANGVKCHPNCNNCH